MRLHLHTKFLRVLATTLIVLTSVVLLDLYTSGTMSNQLARTAQLGSKREELFSQVDRLVAALHTDALLHVSAETADDMVRYEGEIARGEADLSNLLDAVQNGLQDQATLDKLAAFRQIWQAYARIRDDEMLSASRADRKTEARALALDSGAAGAAFGVAFGDLEELQQASAGADGARLAATRQRNAGSQDILAFVTLVTTIAILAFGIWASSQMASNMQSVLDAAQLMASGDLDWRVTIKTGDELESMAELLNRITRNMKKILTAKREVTEQLQRESSELKLTQGLLAAEGQRFAVTLNLIDNGVVTADGKGLVTAINQAASKLTGWIQEEAVGKPLDQVCHIVNQQTGERCNNLTQRALDSAGMLGFADRTALVARDGSQRRITSAGASIRDSEDNVIGLVLILRDLQRQESPS